MKTVIAHYLDKDETWADYKMDQPNTMWSHDAEAAVFCPLCCKADYYREN